MKRIIILIIILTFTAFLTADFSSMNKGTRSLGMGNAYTAMGEGVESLYFNAAGSAFVEFPELGAAYQNHFGVSDLMNLNMTAVMSFDKYAVGMAIQQVNLLDVYAEDIFYLNLARKFVLANSELSVGANGKFFLVTGEEADVELDKPVDLDLGILYKYRSMSLGYSSRNLLRTGGKEDEMESAQILGVALHWQELLNLTADFEMTPDDSFVRLGIELWFYDTFSPRIGFDDEYLTMGFGLKSDWWQFDFGLKTHEELGTTYRFGINVKYKRSSL